MTSNSFKEKLAELPETPGVYLLLDEDKKVLYIGKAKRLKSRVSSYFLPNRASDIKTAALVRHVFDFEIFLVHTELEALLLERTLIRDHNPKYNILLRDDKEYPLVQIDYHHPWPRVKKVRKREDSEATYLGPYGSATSLNLVLGRIFEVFPLVRCSEYEFRMRKRPCAYYHMKKCLAPCTKEVNKDVYHEVVRHAQNVLEGKTKEVLAELRQEMGKASENLNYELATLYRDQILAFKALGDNQSVVIAPEFEGDIVGYYHKGEWLGIHLLLLRQGRIIGNNHFNLKAGLLEKQECLEAFINQYFGRHESAQTIWTPFAVPDAKNLAQALLTKNVVIKVATSTLEKKLVNMACKNAHYGLEEHLRQKGALAQKMAILQRDLGLSKMPLRIECVDISHIQGTATVASIVTFENAQANKKKYRMYNLADEALKVDDYQSIFEVMQRRFRRALFDHDLPDLILIDGGLGQLNAALKAKEEFPDLEIEIISIAKSRLKKTSSAIYHSAERIFTTRSQEGIELVPASFSFQLLTQLRDEAHRFALKQHRRRRQKVRQTSILEGIKGLGPVGRKKLFAKFQDLEGIKKASLAELSEILTKKAAEAVLAFFRGHHDA